jgi:hypothetical protein
MLVEKRNLPPPRDWQTSTVGAITVPVIDMVINTFLFRSICVRRPYALEAFLRHKLLSMGIVLPGGME